MALAHFSGKKLLYTFFSIVQLINLRGNVLRVIFPISCITNILQYIKKKKKEKEFQEFHSLPSIPFQASFKKFFLELLTINYFVQRNFLNFTLKIMSDPIYQGLAKDTRKRGVKFELIKLSSSSWSLFIDIKAGVLKKKKKKKESPLLVKTLEKAMD